MTTLKTPLYDAHVAAGAKMAPFAGYDMPIQYKDGIIAEHEWVRNSCGIFDVSHMGQAILSGPKVNELLTFLTPSSFLKASKGKARYTVLTNTEGGIIDDFIATRLNDDSFFLVLNAARKQEDIKWITQHLHGSQALEEFPDRALIAIQGPKAESVLNNLFKDDVSELGYMTAMNASLKDDTLVFISRLGYTGEDGFEVSLPGDHATAFWNELLANDDAKPIGLGARDSLRLEMGYPLYGHDLDETTSPIEANLSWVVSKVNEQFNGAPRILAERASGPKRLRVGIKLTDKGIAREGATIKTSDGKDIGILTSGGFSPSLKTAIGQGYIEAAYAKPGANILVDVRGRTLTAQTHTIDFMPANTKTQKKELKKAAG